MPGVVPSPSAWDRVRTVVRAFEGEPIGTTDEARRRRFGSASHVALIYIASAATPGGLYNAKRVIGGNEIGTTGDTIDIGILGTVPLADDCYYFNLAEIGAETHDLTDAGNTDQLAFIGLRWATADDGKPVYVSTGLWLSACDSVAGYTGTFAGGTFVNGVLTEVE